jgi:hypothetical protein
MSETKKDFFNRKETKDIIIPEAGEYDPKNENDLNACGITEVENLSKRYKDLFDTGFTVDSDTENPVATVCKRIEETFSKRELAFLLSSDLVTSSYNQAIENEGLITGKNGK